MGDMLPFVFLFPITNAPTTGSPSKKPTTIPTKVPTTAPTFVPTTAPSVAPSHSPKIPCDGKGKKDCNKLAYCKWKKSEGSKKECVLYDCTVLNKKQCGDKKKGVCEWDKKTNACIQVNTGI